MPEQYLSQDARVVRKNCALQGTKPYAEFYFHQHSNVTFPVSYHRFEFYSCISDQRSYSELSSLLSCLSLARTLLMPPLFDGSDAVGCTKYHRACSSSSNAVASHQPCNSLRVYPFVQNAEIEPRPVIRACCDLHISLTLRCQYPPAARRQRYVKRDATDFSTSAEHSV